MTDNEMNKAAENVINDIFGYADLHCTGFDQTEQTLRLFQEVAQRCEEHITDLQKQVGKTRKLVPHHDNDQREAAA